jgi:hypothetical protein
MSLTWLEASIEALKRKGPMNAAQIVEAIDGLGLRAISGATPEATVGAVLYTTIQDADPRVKLVGPGTFEHTGSSEPPRTLQVVGRLEEMDPRDVWADEARDFTPWLLENAQFLGDALGIDIQLDAREHPVGSFSLDLFGRDETNQCHLIVENQLAETDHKHLGQVLTYAAGTDAATIVWVAPKFRDEHRQALKFLNEKAGENARFFGVEVTVVRIADSLPAPLFTLVAMPSEWRAQVAASRSASELSERREQYHEFWTKYLDHVHAKAPGLTKVRSASTRNWTNINYLRKGINISLAFLSKNRVICEVYIDVGSAELNSGILHALMANKAEVEREVGESLIWDDVPLKRACRIRTVTQGDVANKSEHGRIINWLMDHQIAMLRSVKPLVDVLDESMWHADESEEHESD